MEANRNDLSWKLTSPTASESKPIRKEGCVARRGHEEQRNRDRRSKVASGRRWIVRLSRRCGRGALR